MYVCFCRILIVSRSRFTLLCLKEYYDIGDEARPLLGSFPTHADLFTEMHF